MMKKTLIFILSLTLFISAAGCSVSIKEGSEASPQDDSETIDSYCVIADKNGKQLGKIDSRAVGTAADEGVFYSIYYLKENEHTAKASYGFFYSEFYDDYLFFGDYLWYTDLAPGETARSTIVFYIPVIAEPDMYFIGLEDGEHVYMVYGE